VYSHIVFQSAFFQSVSAKPGAAGIIKCKLNIKNCLNAFRSLHLVEQMTVVLDPTGAEALKAMAASFMNGAY